MKNKKIYNFVDLFCGAGGFSEGFIRNGFRSLLALDNNRILYTYKMDKAQRTLKTE